MLVIPVNIPAREAVYAFASAEPALCLRQLRKSPGFTFTAVLSLALGIGATTAVFSVVYAILMNPYPYANPDRMVHLRILQPDGGNSGFGMTASQWQILRKSPVVEDAFLTDNWNLTVTGSDFPEDVSADYVSSNTFNFMGVPSALGRLIQPSDAVDGQDPQPVVVLSYKFWQRHFNGDPAVLGKTLQMVRKNYTVVGVAAPRFTWTTPMCIWPRRSRRTKSWLLRRRAAQAGRDPWRRRMRPCSR